MSLTDCAAPRTRSDADDAAAPATAPAARPAAVAMPETASETGVCTKSRLTQQPLEKRESVFSTLPPWHPTHGRVLPSEGPSHDLLNLEDASGEQTVGMTRARAREVEGAVGDLFGASRSV